uniref:NACHT domain-containing protein n=1 Tax=Electrophorus electricus TaxID=8005 RepID=A0A4W4HRE4_ELEEL
ASERNAFWDKTYSELQDYCQSLGLVLEVVDFRWGLSSSITLDHMTTELCLREIQLCHKVSAGPSFIALVGNQYGQRSIPHSIPENEFELLLSKLSEDQEGLTLFKRWFIKDNNSVPPQYVLQPITKHFPCYDDPESGPQHEAEVVAWNLMEARLLHLFHTAALEAERAGDISAEQKRKFFKSLTEREMEQGFLSSQQDNCSAVIFVRELPQLKKSEQQKHSSKFFDVTADGLLDTEAQELLNLLKHRIYNAHPSNLDLHSIELSKGAMDKSRKEHKDYLDNFCELIVSQVKGKIGRQAASPTGPAWPWLQQELSHQAKLSEEKCAVFTGRDSLLGKLCLMMWESTNILHAPLVVYGPPGMGKSALLCKLAQEMRSVLEPQAVVAPRLLGTSPLSSDVDSLLKGVCIQVCGAFGLTAPCPQTANSHAKLVRFFHAMLQRVSQQGETLLLILDALDNLTQANNGHKLHWLPKEIPPNVHLVVSTLHKGTALESLRAHVNDDKYFFEVDPLTFDQGRDIVDAYMNAAGRRLTSEQVDVILHSFHQSGSPLHLKLLLDMAKQWSSYTAASDVRLGSSIREVILQFLQALEIKHGRQLLKTLLYVCRCGLSEAELRDVLSLDGDVLAEVYQKCLPPNPTIVRLPPLLWARLRHDLGEHLLERWEQGIIVLRQFTEVVKERYLSVERRVQMHTVLSEYFSGQWSQGRLKPILLPSLETQLNADRKVPSQPMWFAEGTANLRKLQELPYHLVHAGKWEELRHSLLGNLDWLYCKTLSCGVASVIQDLSLCASVMECPEIQLIRDCFLLLKPTLDFIDGLMDSSLLFTEICVRLQTLTHAYPSLIGRLCSQCQDWFASCADPVLVPRCSFMQAPGGPLKCTLSGFTKGVTTVGLSSKRDLLIAGSEDGVLIAWDLKHLEVLHTLVGHTGAVQSVKLTNRGDHCLSTGLDGCLRKWSLLSGKQLFCIQVTVLAEARPAEQIHVLESRAVVLSNTQGGVCSLPLYCVSSYSYLLFSYSLHSLNGKVIICRHRICCLYFLTSWLMAVCCGHFNSFCIQMSLSRYFMEVSSEVCCLELAQHKQLLFCGLRTGTVLIYPLAFPEETLCLPPPESLPAVRGMAISPLEDRNCCGPRGRGAPVRDPRPGTAFPCVEGPFHSLLTHPAALAGVRPELDHHGAAITCIALSNWDTHALIGSQDYALAACITYLTPWCSLFFFTTQDFYFEGVLCAAFSVNDKYVFTGSRDKTIKVWDVATGCLLYIQYVYATIMKITPYKDGFVAISQHGSYIKEGFRCPDSLSPSYNPLRNFRAHYRVTSREKVLERPHSYLKGVHDYNPLESPSERSAVRLSTCFLLSCTF